MVTINMIMDFETRGFYTLLDVNDRFINYVLYFCN